MDVSRRPRRPAGLQAHLRALAIRMATENSTWGYTRIQGAVKNLGHRVGRSTIARILRAEGFPPGRQRPTTWRTFVQAHRRARGGRLLHDRGVDRARAGHVLQFVLELQSRRVQVIGSSPHPDDAFIIQYVRQVTGERSALLREGQILPCDRDPKWSRAVEQFLETTGVRVVRTQAGAPNCNQSITHCERVLGEGSIPGWPTHRFHRAASALSHDSAAPCSVFVERQYCAFAGIVHGQKSTDFIKTLVERRFATPIATGIPYAPTSIATANDTARTSVR